MCATAPVMRYGRPGHRAPRTLHPAAPPTPLPARAPTHRTTVSSAHVRFGGVWWPSTVRSDHARAECSLLKVAFNTIAKCFPTATAEECTTALLSSSLQFSFQCPSGFLAWAAVYANWQVRQKKKHQRQYAATWTRFVSIWIATLKLWATCPLNIPISDHDPHLFIRALQSLLHDGVLQHPHLRVTPPTPPPSKKQQKDTARRLRKQQRAAELEGVFDTLTADGYTLVFTDGSSAETEGVGRVAGYGIYAHPDISISAYVPVHFRQTNNTAELLAVIRALQIFTFGKVAICTDSEYVFLGATGAARRWKLRGWTGSSGPVSNVPLWELLLDTLSTHTGSIKFIKVPSHVDILGNNEADRLADQGRLSHPRCPVLKTPSRDFTVATHTPPIKRRRRSTDAELDSVVQVLNFSPHKDAPDSQAMDAFTDLSRRIDPELLQGDWSPPVSDYSSDEF